MGRIYKLTSNNLMVKPTLVLLLTLSILAVAKADGTCAIDKPCTGDFKIAYWDLRGMAQPIRELAKYLGLEFTEHRYSSPNPKLAETDPERVAQQQSADSYWLHKEREIAAGNHFVNLPEIEFTNDEGKLATLSESEAILLWMVNKSGKEELLPQELEAKVKYSQLEGIVKDISQQIRMPCYTEKDLDSLKANLVTKYAALRKSKIKGLWKILEHYDWLMGDYITV